VAASVAGSTTPLWVTLVVGFAGLLGVLLTPS
jgi:hypothetical protein